MRERERGREKSREKRLEANACTDAFRVDLDAGRGGGGGVQAHSTRHFMVKWELGNQRMWV